MVPPRGESSRHGGLIGADMARHSASESDRTGPSRQNFRFRTRNPVSTSHVTDESLLNFAEKTFPTHRSSQLDVRPDGSDGRTALPCSLTKRIRGELVQTLGGLLSAFIDRTLRRPGSHVTDHQQIAVPRHRRLPRTQTSPRRTTVAHRTFLGQFLKETAVYSEAVASAAPRCRWLQPLRRCGGGEVSAERKERSKDTFVFRPRGPTKSERSGNAFTSTSCPTTFNLNVFLSCLFVCSCG